MLSAFPFAPKGWMFCNGQVLNINTNAALYALIGTTYGGDGRTTFALPDLRGRIPVALNGTPAPDRIVTAPVTTPGGAGNPNMGDTLGSNVRLTSSGNVTVALTQANLPAHTHTASVSTPPSVVNMNITASLDNGNSITPIANGYLAQSKANGASVSSVYIDKLGTTGSVTMAGGSAQVTVATTVTNSNTGSGQPLQAPTTVTATSAPTPPFLAMQYIIAVEGYFPQRN
ncbi:phage Tail Collar domain protein [Janthinobacterium agaricidamnosum NBRC 102515 = DSM 9628]|uniref:Phage Tail Collar domain protein n=2 Tax=Janthinobacterium agaricidamnosum TaxID=55508 RepID=W0V9V8_9BURK|nr:phage Tail Collar domain protein [Janthinobacterium agaricidamnosum NBRC 102515 = DSM 9628]